MAGAATGPVKPVLREGKWAFDMGDVTLEVDPMKGGRITTFKLGTENLLTDATVNATYYGSTLWISPEAALLDAAAARANRQRSVHGRRHRYVGHAHRHAVHERQAQRERGQDHHV